MASISGTRPQAPQLHGKVDAIAHSCTALADDLRHYSHRDLLGRLGAEVQSERRMNLFDALARYARFGQAIERRLHAAARSNHPDESAWLPQRSRDRFFVIGVPARDGNQEGMFVERE